MSDSALILIAGALLAAGVGASLVAGRLQLPGLVLFLGVGMAIGSDGAGWIDFGNYELARRIGGDAIARPDWRPVVEAHRRAVEWNRVAPRYDGGQPLAEPSEGHA